MESKVDLPKPSTPVTVGNDDVDTSLANEKRRLPKRVLEGWNKALITSNMINQEPYGKLPAEYYPTHLNITHRPPKFALGTLWSYMELADFVLKEQLLPQGAFIGDFDCAVVIAKHLNEMFELPNDQEKRVRVDFCYTKRGADIATQSTPTVLLRLKTNYGEGVEENKIDEIVSYLKMKVGKNPMWWISARLNGSLKENYRIEFPTFEDDEEEVADDAS